MQRIAIIDIGSNSARLVISHIYKNGAYNMVYNQKEALRLSQKLDKTGRLTEEAFASTLETMKSCPVPSRPAATSMCPASFAKGTKHLFPLMT